MLAPAMMVNVKALLLLFLAGSLSAEEPALWLEPRFEGSPVTFPLPDAQNTLLTAGHLAADRLRPLPSEPEDRARHLRSAQRLVSQLHRRLEPELMRDEQGVVQYVLYRSEHPLTHALLLDPGLGERVAPWLGDTVYAACPDRFALYLFPELAHRLAELSPQLAALYQEAVFPASNEIFRLSRGQLRAIGTFAAGAP
ncbi:MAG: hypothetical protein AAF555_04860 [Verrucomicrobiota bacterium]